MKENEIKKDSESTKEILFAVIDGLTKIKKMNQSEKEKKFIDEKGIQVLKNTIDKML